MSYDEKKLSSFKNIILRDAREKAEQLIENALKEKEEKIKKAKEASLEKYSSSLQEETEKIRSFYEYKITKKSLEAKNKVLSYRNDLKKKILDLCKENIENFSKTADYEIYILTKIEKTLNSENYKDVIIKIKKEDLKFESKILAIEKISAVEEDLNINLGGFKLIDKKKAIEVDETFDTALEEAAKNFYKTYNLSLKNI